MVALKYDNTKGHEIMKKLMRRIILPAFAAVLLSLVACVPEFDHPLSDEKTSKIDPQLLGRWEAIEDNKDTDAENGKKTYWIFSRRGGTANTIDHREETIHLKGDGGPKAIDETDGPTTAFTTTLGGKRYLSVGGPREGDDEGKGDDKDDGMPYAICRYEISDGGVLKIIFMDQEVLGQAVAAKQLPGVVKYTGKQKDRFDNVRITAKPKAVAEYLGANSDKCFKDGIVLTFKRIAKPAPKTPGTNK